MASRLDGPREAPGTHDLFQITPGIATTSQVESCSASLTAGTSNNGTWQCSITFSQFAAPGDWVLSFLRLVDRSSNSRTYRGNVDEDGTLCYSTPAGDVCENFGNTVINLP